MILVENAVISDDIKEHFFVCDLTKCKGACCVEGDAGAPLEEEEIPVLEQEYENIRPFLSEEGKEAIRKQGVWAIDQEGEKGTTTIGNNGACAFSLTDEKGVLSCGIEQAYLAGKTTFRKPISCHLYPIRVKMYDQYEALNYDRWDICDAACALGKQLGVPLYRFLKDALIRKYGEEWYAQLVEEIEGKESYGESSA
ncbi:hypothetical protein ADIS_2292 [Lunatimonas lonarensis]|uniref:DUF3109 family protein n=1 Tax=Lunatimonas lonarensis TaxID=1232681 RepID=R7ZT05_9BACT|nr:DUF3109 family protein [Lunatimonas lonarensis]EON77212.1 hypothetical protein ADIS_2292 [Lunatimonas lonarensis]